MANKSLHRLFSIVRPSSSLITRSVICPCPHIWHLEKLFERDSLDLAPKADDVMPKSVNALAGDPRIIPEPRLVIREEIMAKWNDRPQRDIHKEWIKNTFNY